MSKLKQRIVVKRISAAKHQAHGGSWKIAYADFMTAMMAFFLVMWLLSISSPKQREGIAEYFKMPLKVAISGGEKSSTSSSVIPGGGTDFTQVDGDDKRSNPDSADADRLKQLKKRLEQVIEANPVLKQFRPQLLIDITSEGLRIQIVDNRNRPMFDLSSAKVQPYMSTIPHEIGPVLNELPNKITLAGHTDATPYVPGSKSYSNWELSADRANASRRELVSGGMTEQKVLRVMGVASTMDLNKADPLDPINRRISIVVLNRRAQAQIEQENSSGSNAGVKLDGQKDSAGQLRDSVPKPAAAAQP